MAKKKFKCKPVAAGEWVQPRIKNYILQCCDCGLLHRMNFRLYPDQKGRKHIQLQAFRVTPAEAHKIAKPFK